MQVVCGNALLEAGESCDDGNVNGGDGCSNSCAIEPGFYCPVPGRACLPLGVPLNCGNGTIDVGEACDDGTQNGYAGYCPNNCGVTGVCGNSFVEPCNGEQCDDGVNDGSYGGCTSICQFAEFCGDGIANGTEQCDMGPANSPSPEYGGCFSNCKLGPYCGDGLVQAPEECDMGQFNGSTQLMCTKFCKIDFYLGP
jgi:cysteine-rich repeat protein